ncbi:MAG: hypothetical protein IT501_11535 [Rubrivivax sp.]|jgi:hypothetical protein|nr:hypothetical protein [Rubrivivax sp.]
MRASRHSSGGWPFTRWLEHAPDRAARDQALVQPPARVSGARVAQPHCGWLDSSLELHRGLAVIEHDEPPHELAGELLRLQARRPLR